jgi:hypothetical protein
MTAAGLTVLFITQDFLHAHEAADIAAAGGRGSTPAQRAIDLGLQWMDRNFSAAENPGKDAHYFYYLYGVERVGLASGYKFFGPHDWFRAGAAQIINRLCSIDPGDGSVKVRETINAPGKRSRVKIDDLSFGLMFLSRGCVPAAINKLRLDGAAWNNRPRDAANLVAFVSESTETALNWQIVDHAGSPEQWLDAPMLHVASHEALPEAAGEKLRRYVELGGMILAFQEGGGRAFAASIERVSKSWGSTLQWRTLPADHFAYTLLLPMQPGTGPAARPVLRGLTNGVRDLIILSADGDLPRSFQLRRSDVPNHFAAAANIYLYASEMNRPRPRLTRRFNAAASLPINADSASPTVIVRASHEGNWNPEPLALEVFAARLAHERHRRISIQTHRLQEIAGVSPRPALVVISGVEAHEFSEAEKDSLKRYVAAGGVALFETAGGLGPFAAGAEEMAAALFSSPVRPLLRSRIITGEGLDGAAKLTSVEYRPFMLQRLGSIQTSPRLRGIEIDGQARVLFSREDITHALLDQPCWGISGYSPQSARELLANIVRHAAVLSEP